MKRFIVLIAALGLLVPVASRASSFGSNSVKCGNNGTITWSPTTLWPPNHKLQNITFTYTDPDGGDVMLEITAKPHSDTLEDGTELNGTGNTPPATDQMGGANSDSDGSVDVVGNARAERSGHSKNGRTYSFEYTASDNHGADGCMSDPNDDSDDLTVFVPHDCRDGACRG
jgi:hypothetical protein